MEGTFTEVIEGIEEVDFQRVNGRFWQGEKGIRLSLRNLGDFRNDSS